MRERPAGAEDPCPAWEGGQNDELVSHPKMAALPPYEAQQQFASAAMPASQPSAPPLPRHQGEPAIPSAELAPEGAGGVAGAKTLHGV